MTPISEGNRRDGKRIAAWIALVGRQTVASTMVKFGLPLHYTQRCMRAAKLDGLLSNLRCDQQVYWMLPADVPAIRAQQRKAASAYGLARYQRLRAAGVIDHKGALLDPEHWPVVQRTVSAIEAEPLKTRSPASVFHLGAMAC
jgi:hypothetical protein